MLEIDQVATFWNRQRNAVLHGDANGSLRCAEWDPKTTIDELGLLNAFDLLWLGGSVRFVPETDLSKKAQQLYPGFAVPDEAG